MAFGASLLCVWGIVFIGLLLFLKVIPHFYPTFFSLHKDQVLAYGFYVAFLVGGILLSDFVKVPNYAVFSLVLSGFSVLSLERSSFSCYKKYILQFLLCLGVMTCLYPLTMETLWSIALFTFLWLFIWHLFLLFDRFPLVSSLTSFAWMIALLATGLMMHTFPDFLLIPVALTGAGVSALTYWGKSQGDLRLGRLSASLVGFAWAGIWVYFLQNGSFFAILNAFGYYLFEGFVLCSALYFHCPLQTYLTYTIMKKTNLASKAVGKVLSHLMTLSFFAVMTVRMKMPILSLFVLLIVLLDLYLCLDSLIHPQPSWRELFKNTRGNMTLALQQLKSRLYPQKNSRKKPLKRKKKAQK